VSDGYSPLDDFTVAVARLGELRRQRLLRVEVFSSGRVALKIDESASDVPARGNGVYLDVEDVLSAIAMRDPIEEFVLARSGTSDGGGAPEHDVWEAKFAAAVAAFPAAELRPPLAGRARARLRAAFTDALIALARRAGYLARLMYQPSFRKLLGARGRRLAWRALGAKIADSAWIGEGVVLRLPQHVTVGAGTQIAGRVRIESFGEVRIGRNVLMKDTDLYSTQHDVDHPRFAAQRRTITIGDYALLANRIIILPGVRIGSHAVVRTGSVVARDVPDYGVAAGNPAEVVGERARIRYTYVPSSAQRAPSLD
jgi:acetyltransferase-like isoleucine patch superfamily enzyme